MQTLAHPSHRSPSNRFVCQQQRNEIMQHFLFFINIFLIYFFKQFKKT